MKFDIYKKDIKEIFEYFLDKVNKNIKINGRDLAKLTQILIDKEIKTGGPYKNNKGEVDIKTNEVIYKFLLTQEIDLPNLKKFLNINIEKKEVKKKNDKYIKEVENLYKKIIDKVEKNTKEMINEVFFKMKKSDTYEIIIYNPVWTNNQLKDKIEDKEFLKKLSCINILGWIAYTIYDDILDKDKEIEWLPVANIVNRKMDEEFLNLMPINKAFIDKYRKIMNEMDEANLWEIKNCRNIKNINAFDSIEKLSNRSMGHALTSLALLYKNNSSISNIKNTEKFYKYYLAARQMNDDGHDWEKDLKIGQINSASSRLLINLNKEIDINELKIIFWEKYFDNYAKDILNNCKIAKDFINKSNCFDSLELFDRMLNKVINATKNAIDEKNKSKEFINEYFKK